MGGSTSAGKSITFTTSAPVSVSQIESLELGTVSVDKLSDIKTQVTISDTSKETMIVAYLSKALDTEVVVVPGAEKGIVYEIRTEVSEQHLRLF